MLACLRKPKPKPRNILIRTTTPCPRVKCGQRKIRQNAGRWHNSPSLTLTFFKFNISNRWSCEVSLTETPQRPAHMRAAASCCTLVQNFLPSQQSLNQLTAGLPHPVRYSRPLSIIECQPIAAPKPDLDPAKSWPGMSGQLNL